MRITNRILATTLLSQALAGALLVGGCDQQDAGLPEAAELQGERDEPTEAQTLAFSKELVVTDGASEVVLLVASNGEGLIDAYDDDSFELVPVFERPAPAVASPAAGDEDDVVERERYLDKVLVEEQSVRLEDGAIGYELRYVGPTFRDAIQDCQNPNVYTSSMDYAYVEVTSGSSSCAEARISTRKYSWSWYEEKAHATLCGGMDMDAGKDDTNRVKLEICPGPAYSHSFHN